MLAVKGLMHPDNIRCYKNVKIKHLAAAQRHTLPTLLNGFIKLLKRNNYITLIIWLLEYTFITILHSQQNINYICPPPPQSQT